MQAMQPVEWSAPALELSVFVDLAKLEAVREFKQLDVDARKSVLAELQTCLAEPALASETDPGKGHPLPLLLMLKRSALARKRYDSLVKHISIVVSSSGNERMALVSGVLVWTIPYGHWKTKLCWRGVADRIDDVVPLLFRTDTVYIPQVQQQVQQLAESVPGGGLELGVRPWDFVNDRKFCNLSEAERSACLAKLVAFFKEGLRDSSFGLLKHLARSPARSTWFSENVRRLELVVVEKQSKLIEVEHDGSRVSLLLKQNALFEEPSEKIPFGPLLDMHFKWCVLEECFAGEWCAAAAKLAPQLPEGVAVEPDLSFTARIDYVKSDFFERDRLLKVLLRYSMDALLRVLIRGILLRSTLFFNAFSEKVQKVVIAYQTGKNSLVNGVLTLAVPAEALEKNTFDFGANVPQLLGLRFQVVLLKMKLVGLRHDVPVAYNFAFVEGLKDSAYEQYLESAVKIMGSNLPGLKGRPFSQIVVILRRAPAKLSMVACGGVLEISFDALDSSGAGTARAWKDFPVAEGSLPIVVPDTRAELFPERQGAMGDLSASRLSLSQSGAAAAAASPSPSPPPEQATASRRGNTPVVPVKLLHVASPPPLRPSASPRLSGAVPPPAASVSAAAVAPVSPAPVSPAPAQPPAPVSPAPARGLTSSGSSSQLGASGGVASDQRLDARTVQGWSAAEVARWLREALQLAPAAELFLANEVDGATLLELSAEDIRGMGVAQLGVWKKILRERDQVKSRSKLSLGGGDMIPDEHLELVKRIGGGHFGEVWMAKWNALTNVAVKWLLTENANEEFLAEVQVLQKVRHPHVIETFGVSMDKDARLRLVTELLDTSLLSYLRDTLHHETPVLLDIAIQICKAGVHLAKHGVVHRDLAARNILLKLGGMIPHAKMCDFGLGKGGTISSVCCCVLFFTLRLLVMEENYYMVSTPGVPLPLKWTAPEAMEKKTFSEKSDVWSFGVVMFEMFSHGADPYLGWNPKLILQQLREGERLLRPHECPPDVFAVMLRCWEFNRAERPTFAACYESLHAIQEETLSRSRPRWSSALSGSGSGDADEHYEIQGPAYLDDSA